MENYRIIVERINQNIDELPEDLRGGVICDGFALICDDGDHANTVAIQHMTTLDVARGIGGCPSLCAASKIAEALNEAQEIERKASLERLRKIVESD